MSILKKICSKKLDEVNELKKKITFNKSQKFQCRGFLNNLIKENKENYNIIAEIKRSSPSKGIIRENFNLTEIASS